MARNLQTQDQTAVQGQTIRFRIVLEDVDGRRFNLTGHKLHLHVKNLLSDEALLVDLETGAGIVHADPQEGEDEGVATATIASSVSATIPIGKNFMDLWLEKPPSSGSEITPVIDVSELNIRQPVSVPVIS